jgi:hypothetical protein
MALGLALARTSEVLCLMTWKPLRQMIVDNAKYRVLRGLFMSFCRRFEDTRTKFPKKSHELS